MSLPVPPAAAAPAGPAAHGKTPGLPPAAVVAHATTVAFGAQRGILIEGPSGSGKSQLALQLLACGAQLVADDRTVVFAGPGGLFARAPRPLAGLLEARGLGILRLAVRRLARLVLVIDLDPAQPARRLPEDLVCQRLGHELRWLAGPARCADHPGFAVALARMLDRQATA